MSKFFKALEQAERDRAARKVASAGDGGSRALGGPMGPGTPAVPPVSGTTLVERPDPALTTVEPRIAPPVEMPRAPQTTDVPPPDAARPASRHPSARAAVADVGPAPAESRVSERRAQPAPEPSHASSELDPHLVSLVEPTGFAAEQYRALRDLIEHLHRTSDLRTVAVSSPGVGEGKTTTALNLAGALAQDPDARVLLIEGDLRRPTITHQLGCPSYQGPGLIDALLRPGTSLGDVTLTLPGLSLEVVPAGGTPEAAYEVLKSDRFRELLAEARRRYDYVVLDTPPLIPLPDCRVIERLVDGILVVVAAHRTPRKLVEEALLMVDKEKLIGLVFNGDDRPVKGYYGRYYLNWPAESNGHGANGAGRGWWRGLGRWR